MDTLSLDIPIAPEIVPIRSDSTTQSSKNSPKRSIFKHNNPFEPLNVLLDQNMIETMVENPTNYEEQDVGIERLITTPQQSHESNPKMSVEDLQWPITMRKAKRSCTQHPISKYVTYSKLSPHLKTFVVNVECVKIPDNFNEAICDPNWKQAIEEELTSLHKNRTWDITNLPKGKTVVSSKWVFTVKYNPDASITKYKARLEGLLKLMELTIKRHLLQWLSLTLLMSFYL